MNCAAKKLNIDDYQATLYYFDKNNRFNSIKSFLDGEKKAEYIKELSKKLRVQKDNIYVYSDSVWDLPLFAIAGNKIKVNPDKKLKKKNWKQI